MDLDLVEVAAEANPPVCKIMDYNRFKYEAAQRAKESRRKATSTGIKEMKYRPKIGSGDFDTKTRQVARFLGEGHKVKITIMFRGREMSHPELGKRILDQVAENVASVAKVEAAPKLDGRNMIMVLAPDRRAQGRKPSGNGAREGEEVAASVEVEAAPAAVGGTPSRRRGGSAPPTPTGARLSGQEVSAPPAPTGARLSGQEVSAPPAPTGARLSGQEVSAPPAPTGARLSGQEVSAPPAPST
jgi:translation initiation factor IF-3